MDVMPSGWVVREFPGGALCVPAQWREQAAAQWFDPRQPGAVAVQEGGRQAAWFVAVDGQPAVLRHYRRGGLRARLGREAYFWLGTARVRAFAEVRVLAGLIDAGVRVPKPLGALYRRNGLIYRNAILVARIPGVRALAGCLDRARPDRVADAIAAMHRAGVWHADLNAFNILLDRQDRAWLIDFDRAREGVVSGRQARQNLLRLRRSLIKVAGDEGAAWWRRLERAYARLSPIG